jgi:hypothetical protein
MKTTTSETTRIWVGGSDTVEGIKVSDDFGVDDPKGRGVGAVVTIAPPWNNGTVWDICGYGSRDGDIYGPVRVLKERATTREEAIAAAEAYLGRCRKSAVRKFGKKGS